MHPYQHQHRYRNRGKSTQEITSLHVLALVIESIESQCMHSRFPRPMIPQVLDIIFDKTSQPS